MERHQRTKYNSPFSLVRLIEASLLRIIITMMEMKTNPKRIKRRFREQITIGIGYSKNPSKRRWLQMAVKRLRQTKNLFDKRTYAYTKKKKTHRCRIQLYLMKRVFVSVPEEETGSDPLPFIVMIVWGYWQVQLVCVLMNVHKVVCMKNSNDKFLLILTSFAIYYIGEFPAFRFRWRRS